MKNLVFLVILIVLSASECNKSNMKDDKLSIIQQDYTGSDLKLNGFYYREIKDSFDILYNRYFFYRNGVARYGGIADSLNDSNFLLGNYKTQWGLFEIEIDTIRFELWYPPSGGPLPAYVREGIILNDTSFHIDKSYRMIDGERKEVRERDELYQFYQYRPKPDSTSHYLN